MVSLAFAVSAERLAIYRRLRTSNPDAVIQPSQREVPLRATVGNAAVDGALFLPVRVLCALQPAAEGSPAWAQLGLTLRAMAPSSTVEANQLKFHAPAPVPVGLDVLPVLTTPPQVNEPAAIAVAIPKLEAREPVMPFGPEAVAAPVLKVTVSNDLSAPQVSPITNLTAQPDQVAVADLVVFELQASPGAAGAPVVVTWRDLALNPPLAWATAPGAINVTNTLAPAGAGSVPGAMDLALNAILIEPSQETELALVSTILKDAEKGKVRQRDPQLRKELMWFVQAHPFTVESYRVFAFMVDGSAGNTPRKKVESLCEWASGSNEGRYVTISTYYAAYHLYRLGDYSHAGAYLSGYLERFDQHRDRVYLLQALCRVQQNDPAGALALLQRIQTEFPNSPSLPEVLFLNAWVYFQENKLDQARSLLQDVIQRFPDSPSAQKAKQVLRSLAERQKH